MACGTGLWWLIQPEATGVRQHLQPYAGCLLAVLENGGDQKLSEAIVGSGQSINEVVSMVES